MPATTSILQRYQSTAVDAAVEYQVLHPADWTPHAGAALVLHLHGAGSSASSLELARPFYEQAWQEGILPPAVVACPSTPTLDGFYLDWPQARWEQLVAEEFPAEIAEQYGAPSAIAVIGSSMGGYGALKISFADPTRFAAVAAISPAVFPGEAPGAVPEDALPSVLADLHRSMSLGTDDPGLYAANSVQGRARSNHAELRRSDLRILLDCGAEDEFGLHRGATHLHEVLIELGVSHTFRLVPGAGHLGPEAGIRTAAAIGFLGDALLSR